MQVQRLGAADVELASRTMELFKGDDGVGAASYVYPFLASDRNILLVGCEGEVPVGFALGYVLDRLDGDRPMVLLYEIEVDERHRRLGVGRALVDALRSVAREVRARKIWIPTNRSNLAAVALYRAVGGKASAEDDVIFEVAPA